MRDVTSVTVNKGPTEAQMLTNQSKPIPPHLEFFSPCEITNVEGRETNSGYLVFQNKGARLALIEGCRETI